MKPVAFDYRAPETVDEALSLLSKHGSDAQLLAGGQSLGPLLNLRLARPGVVVDINRIASLNHSEVTAKGDLRLGATARQHQVETSTDVCSHWPMLAEAIGQIGHRAIRNRGTIGGSVSHADPAAELPAALTAMEARFSLASTRGTREVAANDFFLGPFTTARAEDEMLVSITVPRSDIDARQTWLEYARRHGDFGLIGVAAAIAVDEQGIIASARLVYSGADWHPWEPTDVPGQLVGVDPTPDLLEEVGHAVASASNPPADIHASSDYRRMLIATLTTRALRRCVSERMTELT